MILKSLELSGFKSFAKRVTLNFPKTISAIVGPNGSGKSNISEAVAWVLGEQSLKNLRGKKGEDLIFNGSASSPRMSKASVSLTLVGKEGGDTVSISRTVYRDGVNEYFINGEQKRLKDVMDFLNSIGIGSLRYYIISQGEADSILHASPKERREMLEDALGLRLYQLKKERSKKKLEKTQENIKQIESLRREIRPHLKFLQKQVDKAEKVAVLKEKLKGLCLSYFSKVETKLKREIELLKSQKEKIKREIKVKEAEFSNIKARIESLSKDKAKNIEIRRKVNELEREMGRYEGILSQMKSALNASGGSKEKKESHYVFNVEKVGHFLQNLERQVETALSAENIYEIKTILRELKREISDFFSKKKEEAGDKKIEEYKKVEQKYFALQQALKEAKDKETRFQKESDDLVKEERRLYSTESDLEAAKNAFQLLVEKENGLRNWHDGERRDLEEAEALLGEKIKLEEVGNMENFEESLLESERREIEKHKIKVEEGGGVGREVMSEYEEVKKRDEFLNSQLEDLKKSANSLNYLIKQLEEKLENDFKNGFDKINREFKRFFEIMFNGGNARLVIKKLEKKERVANDEEEEIDGRVEEKREEGLEIEVRLPRKKVSSLSMLSGGERVLTSIALLFALCTVNPPPFLILDETDAALDESNSRKYSKILKDLSQTTQLILITHNRETMGAASVLYGVTMGNDSVSRLLSVKLEEAEELIEPTS